MSNPDREKKLRPSSEAKRAAIIDAAAHAFFVDGYEGASIEAIATKAGVSKVTVYNHFGTKEALFACAVDHECGHMRQHMRIDPAMSQKPIAERLEGLARAFLHFLSRDEIMAFDRRIAAESDRDPAVGIAFLDAGPRPMMKKVGAMLGAAAEAGELRIEDPDLAAEQFVSMVKGFGDMERRFGGQSDPARDEQRISGAIEVFLRAYGA